MKIAIGCDHIGYPMKLHIIQYLQEKGYEMIDCGAYSDERCNYPIYGQQVAMKILEKEADLGILICGTGVGISLAANKMDGIRAVVCLAQESWARQWQNRS